MKNIGNPKYIRNKYIPYAKKRGNKSPKALSHSYSSQLDEPVWAGIESDPVLSEAKETVIPLLVPFTHGFLTAWQQVNV